MTARTKTTRQNGRPFHLISTIGVCKGQQLQCKRLEMVLQYRHFNILNELLVFCISGCCIEDDSQWRACQCL